MTEPKLTSAFPYKLWPAYTPARDIAALGAGGRTWLRYALASFVLVVPFCFAPVSRATGLGPGVALAIIVVFITWQSIAVALQRSASQFWSFHFIMVGNLFLNTGLALALAVVPGDPRTPLFCFACAYACMNAASTELGPNIGCLVAATTLPLLTIPLFLLRGADPTWSVAGPALASGASALGYHVIALHTVGAMAMRDERDAALERVRSLEAERARTHLARDLHDSIGPALSVAAWYGELLERGVPASELAHLASGLRASAKDGLTDLRAILTGIAPASATLSSLAAEFRATGARLSDVAEIELAVSHSATDVALQPSARTTLTRVFQEATHNAIRHGGAKRIEVSLAVEGPTLTLTVVDDGRGVAEDAPAGRGLVGMRERATELGGTFVLEARPRGGTAVRMALPMPAIALAASV